MSHMRKRAAVGLSLAVAVTGLSALPASANPAGTDLVISEVYGAGGNSGASYNADFVELYNPGSSPISLSGLALQYRSAGGGSGGSFSLSGSVPAGKHYLVQISAPGANGVALPSPDATASPAISMAAGAGQVLLLKDITTFTGSGNVVGNPNVVDMVGYGTTATTYETAPTATISGAANAVQRNAARRDTDNNSADFTVAAAAPQNCDCATPPPEGGNKTIAEIQGDGDTSPLVGATVTTRGVVTASYPTGGFNGFYIQTDGTGGATDATPGRSDAVFVFGSSATAAGVAIGDLVEVTGIVSEFAGTTEITPGSGGVTKLAETPAGVTPLAIAYPRTDAEREAHEGELIAPTGHFTVTNTYSTNQYAEVGLAAGDTPLMTPTEVKKASDKAGVAAVVADNAARAVTLDDGASINFLSSANQSIPLPWLSKANPVRVSARATIKAPVILEYRNGVWKFQPTSRVTDEGKNVVAFENTRTQAPEAVPGNLHVATFNVLNYFNTTGADYVKAGGSCTWYDDRQNNHNTVRDCGDTGPRGAAEADDLERQQTKIVAAINALGADVVSLEEIENSVALGEPDRDDALSSLVTALNQAAGSTRWAYAPSPAAADLPPLAEQDVIRTAFIYNPNTVSLVGASKVLVGSAPFSNAREPLGQAFKPKGASNDKTFAVVVNHFKSKGSGVDDGTGQGNANPDRVAQAKALVPFAQDFAASRGTDKILLTGDFNSYTQEDPMQVLYEAGYKAVESDTPGETTYNFDGMAGSLDHVLANPAAQAVVAGADIWNINSPESVAFEYSRFNYNVTDFYEPNMFRASDHDPEIVGLNLAAQAKDIKLNLLAVNDFHGRINNTTVKWAGTVEQLTDQATQAGSDQTLLVGAGDLVGASEFASAVQKDQPTIDMFNALGLDASAVGNHEFDQGWADLRDRILGPNDARNATWDYLGANVYRKGTQEPVLPEYATYDVNGATVAVVGAVTEETKSLVSPAGIADLTFGDPVDAVNRVAKELSDGDPANGEADVIMATFHAGATQGTGSNYAAEVARGGEFAKMANLDPSVDVIFNGHTHQAYAWDAPVPGDATRTRPIIQTGQYGDNVGQIQLTIDPTTKDVKSYTVRNVARTTTSDDALVAAYPRVAKVKQIVDAALANAAKVGNQPVGSVTGDITSAFAGGSYVNGKYVGGARDDRANESALGDLVANALRDGLPAEQGKADLGIVNPGGLRAELLYKGDTSSNPANTDGVVTYAEANGVLPFVNNVWTVDLTGAQLKKVLEQQWQPAGAARPYLALGLSDNLRVTYDPSKPAGSRITSVVLDDKPLDPAKHYVVSTFSFLGTGGDNFGAFTEGTSKDTGLVDRDLWIQYLKDHQNLAPDYARQQVQESGLPASVSAGQAVSFKLSKLDLTSLGSPANTSVRVFLRSEAGTVRVGDFPVTGGAADVAFTAPSDLPSGSTVVVQAAPSGTRVGLPVTTTATTVTASAQPFTYGKPGTVRVSVAKVGFASAPAGSVEVREGDNVLGSATLVDGKADVTLGGTALEPGAHTLTVRYLGDEETRGSEGTVQVSVAKATGTTLMTLLSEKVSGKDGVTALVSVSADGVVPTGTVQLFVGNQLKDTATLVDGKATLASGGLTNMGPQTVEVRYLGDAHVTGSSATAKVQVTGPPAKATR